MSAVPELSLLLRRPDIWRGNEVATIPDACVRTGFAALDEVLPGGGWPTGALTELLLDQPGIGEIGLLAPALARISAEGAWLAWVAPPLPPYAPAVQQLGVALDRLVILRVDGQDALWCCEQILASGAFGAALAWLPAAQPAHMRRLQVASQGQRTLAFVMRPAACANQSSAASLRIAVKPWGASLGGARSRVDRDHDRLALHILKRRGSPVAQAIPVNVPRPVFRIDDVDAPVVSPPLLVPAARSVSPV